MSWCTVLAACFALLQGPAAVDFGRDVRPILAENCFKCHGPDRSARKAGLRFDTRVGATAALRSGRFAVRPGAPLQSEMLARVTSTEDEYRMPPPGEKKRLSAAEIATLRAWIAQGAEYTTHWAFVRPVRPKPPRVENEARVRNAIDRFVLARLARDGIAPSPEADPATLIRRVSLDLIGLPPTLPEVDAFCADARPDAYERLVDRLLASPHFGERWARKWLDLARYADTNGYEKDRPRSIWPWRDWVIRAMNEDKPFDDFTVEQLAGDLLEDATLDQRVATGFHRNTMLNQEGGIDVEEFRFASLVDRVNTTGTTWLGLTVACAQCHAHKYDPIRQEEFYGLLAFFNNCDEVVQRLPDPAVDAARRAVDARIAALEATLPDRFPPPPRADWKVLQPLAVRSENGATLSVRGDSSVQASGERPAKDVYVAEFDVRLSDLGQLRVEALRDAVDPAKGPGRTAHGNFVLSEIEAYLVGPGEEEVRLGFETAQADFSQPGYAVGAAIDGNEATGWAIHGPIADWRRDRTAWFGLARPHARSGGGRLRVVLRQDYGADHTLARFRISALPRDRDQAAAARRRRKHLRRAFRRWLGDLRQQARAWRVVVPATMRSAYDSDFRVLEDGSVLVYGNNPDRDTTTLTLETELASVTAIRVEALPHASLPADGPGRSPFFPEGGFMISGVTVRAGARSGDALERRDIASASASHEPIENPAAHAIDQEPDTGWTNKGRSGTPLHIVFRLARPIAYRGGARIELGIAQHSIHNNNLGRFRISLTDDRRDVEACPLPAEAERLLAAGRRLSSDERRTLREIFLRTTPMLAHVHAEIDKLEQQRPRHPTTLVLRERDDWRRRTTRRHHRGEFLQRREVVRPHTPAALHAWPPGWPKNRLSFARWLMSPDNPLTARVTVNRWWEVLFGSGLVRTAEDFGTRGDAPSHPALLDWLATELTRVGWSRKAILRRIVTSATYRQSARATPAQRARDPDGRLLSRAPRFRLDAELVRDLALRASGLLARRIGGPSVFPPQPEGIGGLSYGALAWKTSNGEDRYRRGLYTYMKRTAPYAMFALFDAPSGEACTARRNRTNTPLQALTMLNDPVFVEAAQALARRVSSPRATFLDDGERVSAIFRRVLTRRPTPAEEQELLAFHAEQRQRLVRGELDPAAVTGELPPGHDPVETAAWSCVARVILNLDETITRN